VHNVLVHATLANDAAVPLHKVSVESGWIGTLGRVTTLHRNAWGEVVNDDGEVYALLHQYDRSDAMKRDVSARFPLVMPEQRAVPFR
jgi:hypothetical protein